MVCCLHDIGRFGVYLLVCATDTSIYAVTEEGDAWLIGILAIAVSSVCRQKQFVDLAPQFANQEVLARLLRYEPNASSYDDSRQ